MGGASHPARERAHHLHVRVKRSSFLAALVVACCAACSGSGNGGTTFSIVALNAEVGRAVFHLQCDGAHGDVPDPSGACAALRAKPALVTAPKPFNCFGGPTSHWQVTIAGRVNGKRVRRTFDTCWTPQMETIRRLGLTWPVLRRHLAPRRHEIVLAGETRRFPRGALRAADLVSCDILGHHLQAGVPLERGPGARVANGFSGLNVVSVNLVVERHADGSVTATCTSGTD